MMRLELTLQYAPGTAIPTDYRAGISAWIYSVLEQGDSDFARHLHNKGYGTGNQRFKYFTFGQLYPKRYLMKGGTMELIEAPATLEVSFFLPDIGQHLLLGLFEHIRFHLGSRQRPAWFQVEGVRMLPSAPLPSGGSLRMATPCCIAKPNDYGQPSTYLPPDHPEFGDRLWANLRNKALALPEPLRPSWDEDMPCTFELLGGYKEKLHRIHDSKVKGYCFDFRLQGPSQLLEIGYYGGFGERGAALGFGMAQVL